MNGRKTVAANEWLADVMAAHFDNYPHAARHAGRDDYRAVLPGPMITPVGQIAQMATSGRSHLEQDRSSGDPELIADLDTALRWLDREPKPSWRLSSPGFGAVTGPLKVWRGGNQLYDFANELVCEVDCATGDNLSRLFYGLAPSITDNIFDTLGSAP